MSAGTAPSERTAELDESNSNNFPVLLTFEVGPFRLCASPVSVVGIIEPPELVRLPGTGRAQLGVFFHGRRTALTFDLHHLLGLGVRVGSDRGLLIIVEIEHQLAAFRVDRVCDTPEIINAEWREAPAALAAGVVERLCRVENTLHLFVRFERLLDAKPADVGLLLRQLGEDDSLAEMANTVQPAPAEFSEPAVSGPPVEAETPPPEPGRAPVNEARGRTAAPVVQYESPGRTGTTATRFRPTRQAPAGASGGSRPVTVTERLFDYGHTAVTNDIATPVRQSAKGAIAFAMIVVAVASWLIWEMLGSSPGERRQLASRNPATEHTTETPMITIQPVAYTRETVARPAPAKSFSVLTADFEVIVDRGAKPVPTGVPDVQPDATRLPPPKTLATQPAWEEMEHVVVKGDTLWDITRRYIGDPFRYPELARLSQIRNPDLIYPGDRVKIRKKIRTTERHAAAAARRGDPR